MQLVLNCYKVTTAYSMSWLLLFNHSKKFFPLAFDAVNLVNYSQYCSWVVEVFNIIQQNSDTESRGMHGYLQV